MNTTLPNHHTELLTRMSRLLLLLLWICTCYLLWILPATIPTHFNYKGQPDDWGAKTTIIVLPVVASFAYALLGLVKRMPDKINYPVKQTTANKQVLHQITINMLGALQIGVILLFGRIALDIYLAAEGRNSPEYFGVLPCVVLLIVLPVLYYLVKMFRLK